MRSKFWYRVPSESVLEALPLMRWAPVGDRTAAMETAALMVYVALIFSSEHEDQPGGQRMQIAAATYQELQCATGLSRKLLAGGLSRLIELGLIEPVGSHQRRRYLILWKGESRGWFKLPCSAILRDHKILPFGNFTLRSKHELQAMKLYLYLAAARSNSLEYCMASYETIFKKTLIPERDIRRAISLLLTTGLLRSVNRENEVDLKKFGPNQYFFAGCERLRGFDSNDNN